jgi:hypothetical protein
VVLDEVEAAVAPVPDAEVSERHGRPAGTAAHLLQDERQRPVAALLDILDLDRRVRKRRQPFGEEALQAAAIA